MAKLQPCKSLHGYFYPHTDLTHFVIFRYSYSRSRGLFGGVSIEGSVIVERQDANQIAYESPMTARLLLGGTISPPAWATPLIKTLEACTGLPGNRQWIKDEGNRTPGGSYAFGGLSSPGGSQPGSGRTTPSFLRRKKKDSPSFPPASWGTEGTTGSYFTETAPLSHSRNMTWGGPTARSNTTASPPATSPFDTHFESDFDHRRSSPPITLHDQRFHSPPNPTPNVNNIQNASNPFASTTDEHSYGSSYPFTPSMPAPAPTTSATHKRPKSLGNFTYPQSNSLLDEDYEPGDPFAPTSTLSKPSTSPKPFIKTRDELTRPLQPHEGVAKAIALFDFDAVEDGDLSFMKGEVIIITKKSYSTDDWYVCSWTLAVSD